MDMVHDSDHMVKIQALISTSNLIKNSYLGADIVRDEIFPIFLKLFEQIHDNEDAI